MHLKQLSKEEAVELGLNVGDRIIVRGSQAKLGNYNQAVGCLAILKEMKSTFGVIEIIDEKHGVPNWIKIWAVNYADLIPEKKARLAMAKRQLIRLEL